MQSLEPGPVATWQDLGHEWEKQSETVVERHLQKLSQREGEEKSLGLPSSHLTSSSAIASSAMVSNQTWPGATCQTTWKLLPTKWRDNSGCKKRLRVEKAMGRDRAAQKESLNNPAGPVNGVESQAGKTSHLSYI